MTFATLCFADDAYPGPPKTPKATISIAAEDTANAGRSRLRRRRAGPPDASSPRFPRTLSTDAPSRSRLQNVCIKLLLPQSFSWVLTSTTAREDETLTGIAPR
jgi:hypothetical protein